MKDINFVKTLTPKEQHSLRKWVNFSFAMLCLVILAIASLQIPQLTTLKQTKKEHLELTQNINTASTRLAQTKNLKNKVCCLNGQCKTINTFACATQTPRSCINSITNACTNNIQLQTCNLKTKQLTLTAQCTGVQQAMHFLEQLNKNNTFSNLQLISLQPAPGNFVTFTIKGLIKG